MANLTIPNLYLLAKDHKELEPNGDPKTRPVCTASETMNIELSEWVTDVVEAALATGFQTEVISTEEKMKKIDDVKSKWRTEETNVTEDNVSIVSLDAVSLYPS